MPTFNCDQLGLGLLLLSLADVALLDRAWLLCLLCAGGLALFFVEVFVPSAGMIGLAGLTCVVFAIWKLFELDHHVIGSLAIVTSIVYTIGLVTWGLRRVTSKSDLGTNTATGADVEEASHLIGTRGVALSDLRPSGVARIDGKRFDVVTRGPFVEQGATVEVIETKGNRIVVRAASTEST